MLGRHLRGSEHLSRVPGDLCAKESTAEQAANGLLSRFQPLTGASRADRSNSSCRSRHGAPSRRGVEIAAASTVSSVVGLRPRVTRLVLAIDLDVGVCRETLYSRRFHLHTCEHDQRRAAALIASRRTPKRADADRVKLQRPVRLQLDSERSSSAWKSEPFDIGYANPAVPQEDGVIHR